MGFGIATKEASNTSEIFYSFRKVSEASITSANSCSLKGANQRTREWAEGAGVLGGRRSPESGDSEVLEDVKNKSGMALSQAESRKA